MNTPLSPISFLTHPDVDHAIRGALLGAGWGLQDLDDGVQDVLAKLVVAFKQGTPVPADLDAMQALARAVAKNHAIDTHRAARKWKRHLVGPCEDPGEYGPLDYGAPRRDPVDARRQLAVLLELFREGAMPEDGVDILERVGSGSSLAEIAAELGVSVKTVRWRLDRMRRVYRARMQELGIRPGADRLRVLARRPAVVQPRRRVA